MRRELLPILRTHLSAGLEHSLVHLPVFADASIELEGRHASLLENVLHHAFPAIDIRRGLWRGLEFLSCELSAKLL